MGSPDARQVLGVLLAEAGIELDSSEEEQFLEVWREHLPRLRLLRRLRVPGYTWPVEGARSQDG